nr:unnamed protein product [Digitaria exilis]
MAPPLPTELEEEILLRFPPHEPELLVRASLVCKRWRRLVSAPAFRRRLRDLHRAPPMLGFLCNIAEDPEGSVAAFTCEVKKVCEGRNIYSAIPYVSFHTPGFC